MKKVLLTTLLFTLIAALIAGMFYTSINRRSLKEGIAIVSLLALLAAIPVIIGYVIANISLRSPSPIWLAAKFLLFVLNGFLLLAGMVLTIVVGFEISVAFVSVPFMLAGFYIYYETIRLIRRPPNAEAQVLSESGVLDDFFMDAD
jgi:hypothetical protein